VTRKDLAKLFGLGLLGNTGYQLFFIQGIERTTASNTSVMLATSPVVVTLLGVLLGLEVAGGWTWAGIASCLVGIFLLVTGGSNTVSFGGPGLVGDLMVLVAVVSFAFYTLGSKSQINRYGPLPVAFLTMVLGSWPLIGIGAAQFRQQNWAQVGWEATAVTIFSGVMCIGVAYTIWNVGIQDLGATRTAIYVIIPPVITTLIGWLILGERFSAIQWIGVALALVGATVTRLSRSPSQAEGAPESPNSPVAASR
jgi:drug/metabolite transporter (DMT)-like permease